MPGKKSLLYRRRVGTFSISIQGPSKHNACPNVTRYQIGYNTRFVPSVLALKGNGYTGAVWAYMAKAYTVIDNLFTILRTRVLRPLTRQKSTELILDPPRWQFVFFLHGFPEGDPGMVIVWTG